MRYVVYTSGFMDDVMFSYNGGNRPDMYVSSSSPAGGTGAKSAAYDCILFELEQEGEKQ